MSYNYLPLDHTPITFQQIKNLIGYKQLVSITFAGYEAVAKCQAYLQKTQPANGEQMPEQWQADVLDTGELVPSEIVKLMLAFKVKIFSYGHSAVQNETIQRLMDMHNNDVLPVVYQKHALLHLCLPTIGEGEMIFQEKRYDANVLEQMFGWKPLKIGTNEWLSLTSGTQFSTAYGLYALVKAEHLLKMADLIAAVSFVAYQCNSQAFDAQVQRIHPHKGQVETAAVLRSFGIVNKILPPPINGIDPVCFRCIQQIHGAVKDIFEATKQVLVQEINTVSDDRIIFLEEDLILEAGNANDRPLELAVNSFNLALCELSAVSGQRTTQLMEGKRELPLYLTKGAGQKSGFEELLSIANGILAENKQLCQPVGHPSVRCLQFLANLKKVLSIELLAAVQALSFRPPITGSQIIENLIAAFTEAVPLSENGLVLPADLSKAMEFISSYKFSSCRN